MLRAIVVLLTVIIGLPNAVAASDKESDVARKPNRLIGAASPYLRQHAYDPVDWYEWGEEAFEKARKENKPVFLSVGYSTCHWCHVMGHESFENTAIADILNARFVAIKVDRERRPEVDETYMLATQLITGRGGWPNSVFLTPDRKPFYAGTYFPPDDFRSVLSQVAGFWMRRRDALIADAEKMSISINTIMTRRVDAEEIGPGVLARLAQEILKEFDSDHGGIGDAPKFPQESTLLFMLRLAEKDGDESALKAVTNTLHAILNGGITDHVGGGFHRYAVDREWRVPHFEKMLYNQALMTQVLLRAYRLTGEQRFAVAARRTIDYVLADLTHDSGGFYSARDADSEGEEGTFYVWSEDQIGSILDADEAAFAKRVFGITFEGNFENGTNILHMARAPGEIAKDLGLSRQAFETRANAILAKLEKARASRIPPHRDEKVVAGWNGMMIAAVAEAAQTLGEEKYERAAVKAADFLWNTLQHDGRLKRTWFEGSTSLDAAQEDYAFAGLGFIALYDLTRDRAWLDRAQTLIATMVEEFRDSEAGDYYMTASTRTFARAKSRTDSGTPSGNAAALEAFGRLARRTADPDHRINGEALLAAISGLAVKEPVSNAHFLMASDILMRGDSGPRQFLSKGVVDAKGTYDASTSEVVVTLRLADGWHVNSHKPLEDFFIPTSVAVQGEKNVKIAYPEDRKIKLGFHDKDVAVYEGEVTLRAKLAAAPTRFVVAELEVQACSDKICLEPETAQLRIPTTLQR